MVNKLIKDPGPGTWALIALTWLYVIYATNLIPLYLRFFQ